MMVVPRKTPGTAEPRRATALRLAVGALVTALALVFAGPAAHAAPPTPDFGPAIDRYAAYDGQDTCDPTVKSGVRGFRALLNQAYGLHTGYVVRDCAIGGTSEHKEGRALDYMLNVNDREDRAVATDILGWLLATDRHGNAHAIARRFGIMYMIWNRRIWKAYQPAAGWQPYRGSNPHTDHIHFSFSWAGALKRTSWWTGQPQPAEQPLGMVELVSGELNRDAYADSLAVEHASGKLWLYPGTRAAGRVGTRVEIGAGGWSGRHDLVLGRFDRDGYDDLLAVESRTGALWLHPGTPAGGAFGTPVQLGSGGWNEMTDLVAGEFNRDAYADLLAVHDATGTLWLYPGTAAGGAFGTPVHLGSGPWNDLNDLVTGEFTGDGYPDLIGVDAATGQLWRYPGRPEGAFGGRQVVDSGGWHRMTDLTASRFDRDGRSDLRAVDDATGMLWLYPGANDGFGPRREIGSGRW